MIIRFLKWALSKFEPAKEEIKFDKAVIAAWPFPVEEEKPKAQVKKKPTVKKATTRTPKKPAVAAKTARTKKAK